MYRPRDTQEAIIHRLKIARGHLDKVLQMVANDEYCVDVLHQLNAIEKALKQTATVVLENHLKTCVADSIKKGDDKKVISEIMKVWTKSS